MDPEVNAWLLGVPFGFECLERFQQDLSVNVQFSFGVRHEPLELRILTLYRERADRNMIGNHRDRATADEYLDLLGLLILQDQLNSSPGDQISSGFGFSREERYGVERGSASIR